MTSRRKSHFVVLPSEDGGVTMHPMKAWLRDHPEYVLEGLDATDSTSQQLRAGLKKQGWMMHELDTEFRLAPPGALTDASPALRDMLESRDDVEPNEAQESEDQKFGLESQLQEFLEQNLALIPINGQRLKVYVDPAGRDGIEYPTAVGPIDILAVDPSGDFYVFELKRGRTPDHTLGQLTRYMGWVSQTVGKGRQVFGVIVAKEVSTALRYAICVVPKVSLFEYQVAFTLSPAPTVT